jgi:hypothetical protein
MYKYLLHDIRTVWGFGEVPAADILLNRLRSEHYLDQSIPRMYDGHLQKPPTAETGPGTHPSLLHVYVHGVGHRCAACVMYVRLYAVYGATSPSM